MGMDIVLTGFMAITVVVLFFGTAVASLIGRIVEEDSNRTIQRSKQSSTSSIYQPKQPIGSRRARSLRPSPGSGSRPSIDGRHTTSTKTEEH